MINKLRKPSDLWFTVPFKFPFLDNVLLKKSGELKFFLDQIWNIT